jgi:hypothetical protein
MTAETATVVVSLAGMILTTVTAGLGLFFTARARTAPLREHLYERQLGIAESLVQLIGRIRNYTTILIAPGAEEFRSQARVDLTDSIAGMSELVESAAALMPVELYVEFNKLRKLVVNIADTLDASADASSLLEEYAGLSTKIALLCRTYLGVEELSEEGIKLLAVGPDLEGISPHVARRHRCPS